MPNVEPKLKAEEVKEFNSYVRLVGSPEEKKLLQKGLKSMVSTDEGLQAIRQVIKDKKQVVLGIMPQDEAEEHDAISSTNQKTGVIRVREDVSAEIMGRVISKKWLGLPIE